MDDLYRVFKLIRKDDKITQGRTLIITYFKKNKKGD